MKPYLLFVTFLSIIASIALCGEAEQLPNASRIAKAKMDFDRTIKKLREDINSKLANAEATAQKQKNLALLEHIAQERKEFKEKGTIPSIIKSDKYPDRFQQAIKTYRLSLMNARSSYKKKGDADAVMEADAYLAQLDEFEQRVCVINRYGMLIETARSPKAPAWRYTESKPKADWTGLEFHDGMWDQGKAAFGSKNVRGATVNTSWESEDIWIRLAVNLPLILPADKMILHLRHDCIATDIYVNGELFLHTGGWNDNYEEVVLTDEQKEKFQPGRNLIAISCHESPNGGARVDIGLERIRTEE